MAGLDLNTAEQNELIQWIHGVIGSSFAHPEPSAPAFLSEMPRCGVFVTLHLGGALRGCIGYIQSDRPLELTIREAAASAAFNDFRFSPLKEEEWKEIDLEISLLSPMEKASSPDELRMGEHGALLKAPRGQGLFLPQVATEQNWNRETFMNQLCRKAGLSSDFWQTGSYTLFRFTARVYPQA
ncbi:AmmeMemoRadiSam system protein A [Oceanispirochaeta sp.]|jgi:AmmeMemoRadiSam system protein A|uniref:AmmeMemoRadiSam system protein A n=1 Tax=Oceanispirochaeta sp. TaxID=2035350 RepID=UPI002621263D|nr:AmmeMemoRadiSam system protein A [Oceanispirochaeta sp.]MDA3956057.1 AmmeMemoRadiSam system protein A [Oceanispirochaeta sp.]